MVGLLDARFDEAATLSSQLTLGGRSWRLSALRGGADPVSGGADIPATIPSGRAGFSFPAASSGLTGTGADPVRGLTLETRARALLAHEDGGYEEWGVGGSLARQHDTPAQGRITAEMGYGLDVPCSYGILTPYGSVELVGGGSRTLRLGWRFELGQRLSLSLAGERRETALARPEHGLMLRTSMPW